MNMVRSMNNLGYTPLHYACRDGHFNIAKYLIREAHCQCNPSCEDNDGDTPLNLACRYSHVQYLISEVHCDPIMCKQTWLYSTSPCLYL